MTSSQAHCAGDEPVSALSKAYEHFFELNFSTGEFAMSIVKILKQVLVVLLCVLLVEFTAQVDAYGSIGQSNDQPAASPAKQSPHELQQLVCSDRPIPGRFGGADSGRFDVSDSNRRGGPLDARAFQH